MNRMIADSAISIIVLAILLDIRWRKYSCVSHCATHQASIVSQQMLRNEEHPICVSAPRPFEFSQIRRPVVLSQRASCFNAHMKL